MCLLIPATAFTHPIHKPIIAAHQSCPLLAFQVLLIILSDQFWETVTTNELMFHLHNHKTVVYHNKVVHGQTNTVICNIYGPCCMVLLYDHLRHDITFSTVMTEYNADHILNFKGKLWGVVSILGKIGLSVTQNHSVLINRSVM